MSTGLRPPPRSNRHEHLDVGNWKFETGNSRLETGISQSCGYSLECETRSTGSMKTTKTTSPSVVAATEGGGAVRLSAANGPEQSEGTQGKLREPGEGVAGSSSKEQGGVDLTTTGPNPESRS